MFVLRKVVLYIAMSLDGYIADKNGSVDWLEGYDSGGSYSEFINTVDTVIMGNTTYRQIITELSPNEWVYKGLAGYVITHDTSRKDENVTFYSGSPCAFVEDIKRNSGGNIWICGGADIAGQLMSGGLIDIFHISVIPVILGGGVRLFAASGKEIRLKLLEEKVCNGIAEVVYEKI